MANLLLIKKLLTDRRMAVKDLAEQIGMTESAIFSLMKKGSTNTATLEAIAQVLDVSPAVFYEKSGGGIAWGDSSIAGSNTITTPGNHTNINVSLPEHGFQKIIKSDGSQTTVEVATTNGECEIPKEVADELAFLRKENGDLKNKIIELQGRLLEGK